MVLLGDEGQVEACFDPFGGSATQDRCTVCGERTTGSEINLEAPNGILGDEGQAEARFGPFGDSVSVGAR